MFGLLNRDTLPNSTADEFEHFTSELKAWALKEHNEDGTHFTSSTTNIPLGSCIPYAGSTAPSSNWLICDGSQVSRVTYQTLFNLIGTTYGAGDGSTTFNIPDLRQRFPLGKAAAGTGSTLGSSGGAIDHTHTATVSGQTTTASNTGATAPGTDSQGSHNHGGATGSTTHQHGITFQGLLTLAAGGAAALPLNHTDDESAHVHSISSDGAHTHTVSSHTHSIGSLSVSSVTPTTSANNPPYLVLNYIILAK